MSYKANTPVIAVKKSVRKATPLAEINLHSDYGQCQHAKVINNVPEHVCIATYWGIMYAYNVYT